MFWRLSCEHTWGPSKLGGNKLGDRVCGRLSVRAFANALESYWFSFLRDLHHHMFVVPTDWAKITQPIDPRTAPNSPKGMRKKIHLEWYIFQVIYTLVHKPEHSNCPPFATVTFNVDLSLNRKFKTRATVASRKQWVLLESMRIFNGDWEIYPITCIVFALWVPVIAWMEISKPPWSFPFSPCPERCLQSLLTETTFCNCVLEHMFCHS